MALFNRGNRSRPALVGAVALAGTVTETAVAGAAEAVMPKRQGETKVVAMISHDMYHNGVAQEVNLRNIFAPKKDWRFIVCRSVGHFSPELIADADLLIVAAASIREPIDLTTPPVADTIVPGEALWSDANVNAVVANIRDRGMGFIGIHATLYARNRTISDLLGAEPVMHKEVQPLWVHSLNQDHPVTKGIGKFLISIDEQFAAVIKSHYTTSLFETTAIHDKRDAVGGWCLENGKGRVACFLPGHTPAAYGVPEYREILWRAAHWAMKRDIPPYPAG